MYVVYINLLYFLSIFLFTYNKNLLSQKKKLINLQKSFHLWHFWVILARKVYAVVYN